MGLRRIGHQTVGDLLDEGARLLHSHSEARLLIGDALEKDAPWVIAHEDAILEAEKLDQIRSAFLRRSRGEPIALIRGWTEWYGHRFRVSKDTLIPRPFSEHLVDSAKEIASRHSLSHGIDVGTGTGCIALSLSATGLFESILATDISPAALDIARLNQRSFPSGSRVSFEHVNLLPPTIPIPSLIIANLPYLPQGQRAVEKGYGDTGEPSLALEGGPRGWEIIVRLISELDHRGWSGWLLLECETNAESEIAKSLPSSWTLHGEHGVSDGKASIMVLER